MMKRIVALVCLSLLALAAPAAFARDLSMEDFMKSNSAEALLSRHRSVALLQLLGEKQAATWQNRDYRYSVQRTDETAREGDFELLLAKEEGLSLSYLQFQDGIYPLPSILIAVSDDTPLFDVKEDLLYSTETTAKEKVQSVREDGDSLVMTTRLSGQDFKDAWTGDYSDGCYCELVYTLDQETLELREDVETVMDPSGKPLKDQLYHKLFGGAGLQTRQQVLYDTPMPDDMMVMLAMLKNYHQAAAGETRTVTYILDAGTEQEKSLSSTGAKGYLVSLYTGSDDYELYVDEAMTQLAPADDLESDRSLYVKWIKEEGEKP